MVGRALAGIRLGRRRPRCCCGGGHPHRHAVSPPRQDVPQAGVATRIAAARARLRGGMRACARTCAQQPTAQGKDGARGRGAPVQYCAPTPPGSTTTPHQHPGTAPHRQTPQTPRHPRRRRHHRPLAAGRHGPPSPCFEFPAAVAAGSPSATRSTRHCPRRRRTPQGTQPRPLSGSARSARRSHRRRRHGRLRGPACVCPSSVRAPPARSASSSCRRTSSSSPSPVPAPASSASPASSRARSVEMRA